MGKGPGRPVKLANVDPATALSESTDSPARRKNKSWIHLQEPFLKAYEEIENETLAGHQVGVPIEIISAWKRNEEFLKRFTLAHHKAQHKHNDLLRTSMIQRAIKGSPHFIIKNGDFVRDSKGEKIVAYYDQEPQLTMFVAKNRMPDEFRDKFEHEITGKIVQILVSEFVSILHRNLPTNALPPIQKELETLSAKLANV